MKSADLSSYKKNKNGINATNLDKLFTKTLLFVVLAASHQSAYAGVKAMTSEEMGEVTGQAGLTIDLDAEAKRAAQNLSDFQASSTPLAVATGNIGIGTVAATTGGLLGLVSAAGYEEQIWSVDFVKDGDDTSQLLSLWGADGNTAGNELAYEFVNIGDHGEVEQTLNSGDMMIHSGKSVHGFGSMEGHSFSVDRSVFGSRGGSDSSDINETIKWGEWDVIFDIETKNLNLNVYIEAERDTILDYLGMTVNVKVHNSRGDDQYIVKGADGKELASFAHFQADVGSKGDSHGGGVYFNILDFSGDVDYANVTFGTGPSIGSVYITDFVIRADMDIYEH